LESFAEYWKFDEKAVEFLYTLSDATRATVIERFDPKPGQNPSAALVSFGNSLQRGNQSGTFRPGGPSTRGAPSIGGGRQRPDSPRRRDDRDRGANRSRERREPRREDRREDRDRRDDRKDLHRPEPRRSRSRTPRRAGAVPVKKVRSWADMGPALKALRREAETAGSFAVDAVSRGSTLEMVGATRSTVYVFVLGSGGLDPYDEEVLVSELMGKDGTRLVPLWSAFLSKLQVRKHVWKLVDQAWDRATPPVIVPWPEDTPIPSVSNTSFPSAADRADYGVAWTCLTQQGASGGSGGGARVRVSGIPDSAPKEIWEGFIQGLSGVVHSSAKRDDRTGDVVVEYARGAEEAAQNVDGQYFVMGLSRHLLRAKLE